jgi:K+-sensing histidine kinase KdpD
MMTDGERGAISEDAAPSGRSQAMEAYLADLFECVSAAGPQHGTRGAGELTDDQVARRSAQAAARMVRLQELTSDLSAALTAVQVADACVSHVAAALGALRVLVCVREPDGLNLLVLARSGSTAEADAGPQRLPAGTASPLTEVMHRQTPLELRSLRHAAERYPDAGDLFEGPREGVGLAMPLRALDETLGVLFVLLPGRSMQPHERDWLLMTARECAAALRRARLYEDAVAQARGHETEVGLDATSMQGLLAALNEIAGHAEMIRRRLEHASSEEAYRTAESLNRLRAEVQQAIEGTRLLEGRNPHEPQGDQGRRPVDLVALLRGAEQQLRERAPHHGLQVLTDETALSGRLDPQFVQQLLDGLVDDAVGHHPQGGEITILLRRAVGAGGSWALITVRDRGTGEGMLATFAAGGQVPEQSQHSNGASALEQVRPVVEQQGGRIDTVSTAGMGNSVTVRLPLH